MALHISAGTGHHLQNLHLRHVLLVLFSYVLSSYIFFGNALVQCVLLNWLVKLFQVDNLHNFGSIDMLDKLEF